MGSQHIDLAGFKRICAKVSRLLSNGVVSFFIISSRLQFAPHITVLQAEHIFHEINSANNNKLGIDELIAWWPESFGTWVEADSDRGLESRWRSMDHLIRAPYVCNVVGAGYFGGQPVPGVEGGPDALRQAGVIERIRKLGWQVNDTGNLPFKRIVDDPTCKVTGVRNPRNVGGACKQLHDHLVPFAVNNQFCLTLGGDHSLAMGSLSAMAQGWDDLKVLWVDAHADINTPDVSPSGNLHGMPLAFLLGLVDTQLIPGFSWLKPCLKPENIVFVGLRDVDSLEKRLLRQLKIRTFSMTEVDKFGIGEVMHRALDHLTPYRDSPVHCSFDIDSIDPDTAPSTGTRVRGGLTYREGNYIVEELVATGCLVSMDLVEVNTAIGDIRDVVQTATVAADIIVSALGSTVLSSDQHFDRAPGGGARATAPKKRTRASSPRRHSEDKKE